MESCYSSSGLASPVRTAVPAEADLAGVAPDAAAAVVHADVAPGAAADVVAVDLLGHGARRLGRGALRRRGRQRVPRRLPRGPQDQEEQAIRRRRELPRKPLQGKQGLH